MNERSLRVLEFHKVITTLKGLTSFVPGAQLAEQLQPFTSLGDVRRALEETGEAAQLLRNSGDNPLAGARDVRVALGRAGRGGSLAGEELLDIAQTATVMRRSKRLLTAGEAQEALPQLSALGEQLDTFEPLEKAIAACIGDDGLVLDRASDKLARLRGQMRTWQARSRERLDAIVRAAAARNVLQETLITVRNDRYVVPVKVEHKAAVPGIVHDTSSSGATVFVEPLAIVELNNKIKQAQAEEEREVQRILRELSAQVAAQVPQLTAGVALLARLDLALAKARLAESMEAVQPQMNDSGWLDVRSGRHPLLTGTVVPIDVWLGKETRILVITGPNTGGKTVTLKTIGLFCLMAQAGLFVPAEGAELSVFRGIYADIGDEQSIEQSLSTFSGHMANIVDILARVDEHSLVLLDELGAGTDPTEGAALAMAILQHLADKDISAVATTHFSELKSFVHERTGMQNASVEFDAETLAPTYRLIMGTPGRSNALEIAARLGLPQPILDSARGQFASADDVRVEDLLRDLEQARNDARAERHEARRLRQEAESLRSRLEQTRAELVARRGDLEQQARVEARQVLSEARQEVESIIATLRRRADAEGVGQARDAHKVLGQRLESLQSPTTGMTAAVDDEGPAEAFTPAPGDAVTVRTLRQVGLVQAGPDVDGQFTVQVGSMRIVVAADDLTPASAPRIVETRRQTVMPAKRTDISAEISLRGMLVDEALHALEKYIDDALLAGLERVLVVHGKGTGTLRRAVHDYVQDHPHVTNWYIAEQSAGGYGATVVEL